MEGTPNRIHYTTLKMNKNDLLQHDRNLQQFVHYVDCIAWCTNFRKQLNFLALDIGLVSIPELMHTCRTVIIHTTVHIHLIFWS